MPRFLKASDIPMSKRKPHLDQYRAQLREALANPSLSDGQRARVQARLVTLGQPKPYAELAKARGPVSLPAAPEEPNPIPTPEPACKASDLAALLRMTKAELCALADERGLKVSSSWKKQQIAEALL